jgi:selenium-binding protein 1
MKHINSWKRVSMGALLTTCISIISPSYTHADETCQSPYLPKITGQEDYVYIWTLGAEGVGDGSDKLVTIGANPQKADQYGKVLSSISVGGRHEAHHGGFTDDRRYLWLGGLDDSKIFIFDVASDPAKPKLDKTLDAFVQDSGGVVGPHTFYPLPGRMLITGLSNDKDHGGKTGMVEYSNEGKYIQTMWLPEKAEYGYDVRVQPHLNRMLTSSFTGWNNYMMDFGQMLADKEAMKRFGQTMVLWDFHARKPIQTFEVPGAPLEIRWALQPRHYYAFTATALTSKLWVVNQKADGSFEAKAVSDIGDPTKVPLPVDISLSADDQTLFINTFMDGMVHVYNVSDPMKPSSLLANWDKKGDQNEQYLKAYTWDGKTLKQTFAVDFNKENLGRPHIMHFGQDQFYKNQIYTEQHAAPATIVAVR